MTFNKRKKNSRLRGSHTHGWGSKKKHRGSGNRGGSGNASTGKRSDAKKPSIWKEDYFGKRGFRSRAKKIDAINILMIEQKLKSWLDNGKIEKKGDVYVIDLNKLGYGKLLGTGKVNNKYDIKVDFFSAKAKESIERANGKVMTKSEVK